jgi:hypothetical protein
MSERTDRIAKLSALVPPAYKDDEVNVTAEYAAWECSPAYDELVELETQEREANVNRDAARDLETDYRDPGIESTLGMPEMFKHLHALAEIADLFNDPTTDDEPGDLIDAIYYVLKADGWQVR